MSESENNSKKVSIVIPVFNEQKTIRQIIERVTKISFNNLEKEIIVVDDGSNDKTREILRTINDKNIKIFYCQKNQGKGAALQTGFKAVTGDFIIIQDADLEYDPADFKKFEKPILSGFADVVYGSRFIGGNPHRILFFWHSLGNKFLTNLSNMFTNLNLTDMETCYKVFKRQVIQKITIEENRFGFEPELTAKLSRIPNIRIYEVGISYYGRTFAEGKKICWKDGIRAIYCIFKYWLF